jgi:hypothetical protein
MPRWPTQTQKNEIFRRIDYAPYPEQRPFHHSTATILQLVGAEGAGKSHLAAAEIAANAIWSTLVYLIGQTYEQPHREFDYLVEHLFNLHALDPNRISRPKTGPWELTTRNGCRVVTLSVERGAISVIARGEQPDIFCLCEAGVIGSYSVFLASVRRATRSKGRVLLVGTLRDNFGWYASLVDELSAKGNPWGGQTLSLPAWVNLSLYPGGRDDPEIKRLEQVLPADEFARTVAARKVPSPALIFPEFSYSKHVETTLWDKRAVHLFIDPGYFPSAYCVLPAQFHGPHGNEVRIIDEVYLNHHTHEQVIDVCKARPWWPQVADAVIDFAGRQHQADRSAIEVWSAKAGIRPRSQFVDVLDGIARHRTFLRGGEERLYIDPGCTHTLNEYRRFSRPTDRDGNPTGDKPRDGHDHAMKAINYGLVWYFGFVEGHEAISTASIDWYAPQVRAVASVEGRSEEEAERMLEEYGA